MKKIHTVTGQGFIHSQPDMIRLYFIYEHKLEEYAALMEHSNTTFEAFKKKLIQYGFDQSDFKTTYLRYDTVEEKAYEIDGKSYPGFKGFRCRHEFYIDFDLDADKLTLILQKISEFEHINIRITYRMKDEQQLTKQLYEACVEDAKRKAQIIADASSVRLKKILSIDASQNQIRMESVTYHEPRLMKTAMNVTPDTIENSQMITMQWLIKKG